MRISDWSSDVCSSDLHLKRLGIDLPDQVEIDEAVVDRRHQRVGAGREVAREDVVSARRIGDQIVGAFGEARDLFRSEEHTSELQSLMRISYAVFCLQKKKQ